MSTGKHMPDMGDQMTIANLNAVALALRVLKAHQSGGLAELAIQNLRLLACNADVIGLNRDVDRAIDALLAATGPQQYVNALMRAESVTEGAITAAEAGPGQ